MAARKRAAKPIVIWGAKGHAIVLLDFLASAGFEPIAFFDNDWKMRSPIDGVPIMHGDAGFSRWTRTRRVDDVRFAVAIGGDRGHDRIAIAKRLRAAGLKSVTLVHPAAIVSASADIAAGCQILAGAIVGARSKIGEDSIVNTAASIDHECVLSAGVHVGPGAILCGCVRVGKRAFIGAGAVVLPRVAIGPDAVIGAGAVVTKDVRAGAVVAGVPARATQKSSRRERGRP